MPLKVLQYKMVGVDKVQGLIDDGWQPWGSPIVTPSGEHKMQAVVMYEAEKPGWFPKFPGDIKEEHKPTHIFPGIISNEEYNEKIKRPRDIQKTFLHGVYEDGKNNWTVLHMSVCEGGEECRLMRYLNSAAGILDTKFKSGYEYTVEQTDTGLFVFTEKKLPKNTKPKKKMTPLSEKDFKK